MVHPVERLQLNSRYADQDRFSVVRRDFTVRYENPKQSDLRLRSKIMGGPELGTHEFHYLFSKNSLLTGTGNSELDKKLPRRF